MVRRLLPLAILVVLVATACAGSGAPETLDEQREPLSAEFAESIPAGINTDDMPLVQRNFLEGCLTGGREGVDPDLADVEADGLGAVCVCIYDGYVAHFEARAEDEADEEATSEDVARLAYDLFDEADNRLADGDTLADIDGGALAGIAADCIRTEAGAVS